jgi:hypothetical protein
MILEMAADIRQIRRQGNVESAKLVGVAAGLGVAA